MSNEQNCKKIKCSKFDCGGKNALHHVSLICDGQFQAANINILCLFAVNIKF